MCGRLVFDVALTSSDVVQRGQNYDDACISRFPMSVYFNPSRVFQATMAAPPELGRALRRRQGASGDSQRLPNNSTLKWQP
jgi:hypothetical protein